MTGILLYYNLGQKDKL